MPTPRLKTPSPSRPPPAHSSSSNAVAPDQSPTRPQVSLQPSSKKRAHSKSTIFRRVKSLFRSFPVINPPCKIPGPIHANRMHDGHIHGGKQMTGTLFGHRKSRVNLSIQENSKSLPILVMELSIQTGKLLQDMGLGLVRIALECEKNHSEKVKLLEEPIWTMYCNGRKVGYAVKREPTDDDLKLMQMLHAVSMGAGVLPGHDGETGSAAAAEGELTYMRAYFERMVGSKDSETYYMMNPDGNSGPELSIFFVRV
ncbi:protein MIZU-KUSSEI 1-like [Dorcoceras hygrometricum]|uniref:Protein MIZU-KUSSEI 1-like n=1 Tax=Dorcoceras hygrometricum TaxID=472368 RepID=A0A2Z7BGC9_9LAMI|nr:protein MIZU-KUSSEI 1-like [Dorcoceras hygrometricum]KZV33483.1 protein MIZU-KUSSEI 1-like [Dorcoceras hygrometricum]